MVSAVSVFLGVTTGIVGLLIIGSMILVLVYFGSQDDAEEAMFPKIVVVFTLFMAIASVLCLPLDVSNTQLQAGFNMAVLWQAIYVIVAVLITAIVPFAFFYYEADDIDDDGNESSGQRLGQAIKFTGVFLVVFFITLTLMYAFLNQTQIPVTNMSLGHTEGIAGSATFPRRVVGQFGCLVRYGCAQTRINWQFSVTFFIYLTAMLAFLGWFLFAAFTGIGFMALPLDLIMEFVTRPMPMKAEDYARQKTDIGNRAAKLLQIGRGMLNEVESNEDMKSGKKLKLNATTQNRFEAAVYMLKRESEQLFVAHKLKGGNPLWYIFLLILGIASVGLSGSWLVHISIFVLPSSPYSPFLNNFFITMQEGVPDFPLFGVVTYAIYCLYLLWCCMKGAFRFGLRVPFLFKIYPMEVGKTYLNGFLANSWIILVCSVPCVQFCATAFPYYSRNTSVSSLFGTQIRYLQFFRYFFIFNVFVIMMICFAGVTAAYLSMNPIDRSKDVEAQLAAMSENDDDLGVD